MKILFISRSTLYKDIGGDTVQINNTAKFLRDLGAEVSIKLSEESVNYEEFDLIHFFNIIRPGDILHHIKKTDKPFVVSTIFVDYSEYERTMRGGMIGLMLRIFSADTIEYLKAVGRFVLNGEKIKSFSYLLSGHRKSVKKIIRKSSMLLPNSNSEYNRLVSHYSEKKSFMVIPNAIDSSLFKVINKDVERNSRLILCVGRIEGRKNQLNLIKAVNGTEYQLIIIGSPSPNQQRYYQACVTEARSNISFVKNIPQEELLRYYRTAKVHVLASWFETTGLSSLEAAVMGCNIVITDKGDTKEYFEDLAFYCDPASPASIFAAIEKAMASPFREELKRKIEKNYIWEITAEKTMQAYRVITGYSS